jgi:hypothetical protein
MIYIFYHLDKWCFSELVESRLYRNRKAAALIFFEENDGGLSLPKGGFPEVWWGTMCMAGEEWTIKALTLIRGRAVCVHPFPIFELEPSVGTDTYGGIYDLCHGIIAFAENGNVFIAFEKVYRTKPSNGLASNTSRIDFRAMAFDNSVGEVPTHDIEPEHMKFGGKWCHCEENAHSIKGNGWGIMEAEVGATQSQTSSDLRHKPASIHGVIGGAMTPAASRPPLEGTWTISPLFPAP